VPVERYQVNAFVGTRKFEQFTDFPFGTRQGLSGSPSAAAIRIMTISVPGVVGALALLAWSRPNRNRKTTRPHIERVISAASARHSKAAIRPQQATAGERERGVFRSR
jgi:hypothetical protein